MESKNFEVYTAPEALKVEFELNGVVLSDSLKPGESEGGIEGGEIGEG